MTQVSEPRFTPRRRYWQVHAEDGARQMEFGLEAVSKEQAVMLALNRIPFQASAENVTVTEILPREKRRH